MDKKTKEILHYIAVYGALLLSWPILMAKFTDVNIVAVIGFFIFVGADTLAHQFILGEKVW